MIAEQLAPYFNPPHSPLSFKASHEKPSHVKNDINSDDLIVDESWILPVLVALKGVPVVTRDGDIVYKFEHFMSEVPPPPNLRRTTSQSPFSSSFSPPSSSLDISSSSSGFSVFVHKMKLKANHWLNSHISPLLSNSINQNQLPKPVVEKYIPFSNAPIKSQMISCGLGLLHLLGISLLGFRMLIGLNFSAASSLTNYLCLVMYSLSINLFPLFRNQIRIKRNNEIKIRNKNREAWYQEIEKVSNQIMKHQNLKDEIKRIDPHGGTQSKSKLFRKLCGVVDLRRDLIQQRQKSSSSSKIDMENTQQKGDMDDVIFDSNMKTRHIDLKKQSEEDLKQFDRRLRS